MANLDKGFSPPSQISRGPSKVFYSIDPKQVSNFLICNVYTELSLTRDQSFGNAEIMEPDVVPSEDSDEQGGGDSHAEESDGHTGPASTSTSGGKDSKQEQGGDEAPRGDSVQHQQQRRALVEIDVNQCPVSRRSSMTVTGEEGNIQEKRSESPPLFVGDSQGCEESPDSKMARNLASSFENDSQMTDNATQSQPVMQHVETTGQLHLDLGVDMDALKPASVNAKEVKDLVTSPKGRRISDQAIAIESTSNEATGKAAQLLTVDETEHTSDTESTLSVIVLAPLPTDTTTPQPNQKQPRDMSGKKSRTSSQATKLETAVGKSSGCRSPLRVMLSSSSSVKVNGQTFKKLKKHGICAVENIEECDVFCLATGNQITKSARLLQAVIRGKVVVTDDWLEKSGDAGMVHDTAKYLVKDLNIAKACEDYRRGCKPFASRTIVFTPALKTKLGPTYSDFETLATLAGAEKVISTCIRKNSDYENPLWIGTEDEPLFAELAIKGIPCYSKELITNSILQAKLETKKGEYRLSVRSIKESSTRKRKSSSAAEGAVGQPLAKQSKVHFQVVV